MEPNIYDERQRCGKSYRPTEGFLHHFAGYDWYPPLENAKGDGLDTCEAEVLNPEYRVEKDVGRAFAAEHMFLGFSEPLQARPRSSHQAQSPVRIR